jgi:hypothetical protein
MRSFLVPVVLLFLAYLPSACSPTEAEVKDGLAPVKKSEVVQDPLHPGVIILSDDGKVLGDGVLYMNCEPVFSGILEGSLPPAFKEKKPCHFRLISFSRSQEVFQRNDNTLQDEEGAVISFVKNDSTSDSSVKLFSSPLNPKKKEWDESFVYLLIK